MRQFLALIFLLVSLSSTPVRADEDKEQWHECKTDAECVVVMGGCRWMSVNKDSLAEAGNYYRDLRPRVNCSAPPGPQPEMALCKENSCIPGKPPLPVSKK